LILLTMIIFGNKKVRISAILLLIVLGIADATVNLWLKPWIGRVRPCNIFPEVHLLAGCSHSGSFPSSHAANIFGAGTILTFFYRRVWMIWLLIAVSVSFSRIYVGVHYPLDVLAGTFYGILCGVLVLFIFVRAGIVRLRRAARDWFRKSNSRTNLKKTGGDQPLPYKKLSLRATQRSEAIRLLHLWRIAFVVQMDSSQ